MSAHASSGERAGHLSGSSAPSSPTYTIDELRKDGKLWYKLHIFIYDLRNFRLDEKSHDRLNTVTDTYYIGPPYFSVIEADNILHTIGDTTGGKTLKDLLDEFFAQKLEKRLEEMMKETGDYRVCTAHDLAPIVEKVFCVHPKDLAKNKAFGKSVDGKGQSALDEGGVWKCLGKR